MKSPFRADLLKGQVVLVTGGGTGIGRGIALAAAAHGADVAICSRKPEHHGVVKEIEAMGRKAHAVACDVRHLDQVQAMAAEVEDTLGPVDLLVNNAAGNFLARFEDLSPNGWASVVNIVLNGTFNVTKAVGQRMLERERRPTAASGGSEDGHPANRPSIVNIVVSYAWGAAPLTAHSGAAKAGVLNLTRTLAVEWAPKVRVNAVAPGPVYTEGAFGNLAMAPELGQRIIDGVPLKRLGEPEEIAHGVLFLHAHPYMTGECMTIDGGQWLNHPMFQLPDHLGSS